MTNATCRAARTGLVLAAFILAGVLGREAGMAHAEGEAPPAGRTTIYVARKIVTMEPALPEARVVAVRDGLVLGLGERIEDLSPWLASGDYDVDRRFEHDVVMPGFIDPHLHPMMAAVLLPTHFITPEDWDLPRGRMHGVRTPAGYREALGRAIAETPDDGRPFITWGHHAHWHGPVDRALLDELAPERAVIVWQRSFHELTFNTKALERLGLGSEASFAEAIEAPGIEPAHADFAAGHVSETAMKAILPRMAPFVLTPEHLARGLSSLRQMMLAAGVTTIADMATGIFAPFEQEARTLRHTFGGPDASARILLVPTAAGLVAEYGSVDAAVERLHALAPELTSANVLIDDRVKLLADGAFFALAMRMNPPGYTDGHEGKWITAPAELRRLARAYWSKGFTIHCHVNGDE
ncbi:MAG TPA: amidohydrolase family protein, partial [Myxococcota bacterium]|nr:amidohydrolase family protein [Myxococcota bacterium]